MNHCIICGSNNYVRINTTTAFGAPLDNVKCVDCGLCYLHGHPSTLKRIMDKHYTAEFYNKYSENRSASAWYNLYVWFIEKTGLKYATAMSQYAFLKPFLKNQNTVLDVGCGLGQALHVLETKGFAVTGLELDKTVIKDINSKLIKGKCLYATLEDFSEKSRKKYDIIFVSHTFEHFIDPTEALADFSRLMHTNSLLFIEVPNRDNKAIMHRSITESAHTFHFSRKTIKKILNKNGFEIIKMSTCSNKFSYEPKLWTYTKYLLGSDISVYGRNEGYLRLVAQIKK